MTDRSPLSLYRLRRADSDPIRPIDVIVAVGLALLSLLPYLSGGRTFEPRDSLIVVLLLLESLPLIVRRRYPLEVFLVVVTASIVDVALVPEGQAITAGLGILVAMYTIGERLDRQVSLPVAALAGVVLGVLLLGRATLPGSLQGVIQTEIILAVAWLVGDAARIRRLYTAALEERAGLLAREREGRERRAVLEERERIARDLHDVVGHHVSVIVVQAGGGLSAIDRQSEDARAALTAIAAAGRQALTDMRRLVAVLGSGQDVEPMPGLAQLDDLIAGVRSAGLPVELTIDGDSRPLDPALELSAYRIVQEALTNALKHGGTMATATIRYGRDALEVIVEDETGGRPAAIGEGDHEGRGLVGMRERAAMLGGSVDAHATSTGFLVAARLPYPAAVA
ncbi:MAG TPA: histidine kinase [Candidatus Limnocylindrales bacterium]|jgi:signal transduction histidine kinase